MSSSKVWGDDNGQLGIWLEKILRNCVYLLVESPGYTLVDVPLIVDEDTSFRNHLLGNVKYNPYLMDFWLRDFDRLTKRDRTEQVGPALSRLDILRGNPTIRHIVGQRKTTVDFNRILNGDSGQKIVLLRMPVYLSQEVKAIVGAIIFLGSSMLRLSVIRYLRRTGGISEFTAMSFRSLPHLILPGFLRRQVNTR